MCGRYFLSKDFRELVQQLFRQMGVAGETARPDLFEARDVFPSQRPPVICGQTSGLLATPMTWGFTNPARSGLLINARSESVWTKPTFADSMAERRCLIPVSGFYEWDSHKTRYRFCSSDSGLLLLAGIWRMEPAETSGFAAAGRGTDAGRTGEEGARRFTILTTAANDSMIKVHDRMPVTVDRKDAAAWILDDEAARAILGRKQPELTASVDDGQLSMDL